MKKQKQKEALFIDECKIDGVCCGVSLGNSWSILGAIPPIHHPTTFQSPNTTHIPIPKVVQRKSNTQIKSYT